MLIASSLGFLTIVHDTSAADTSTSAKLESFLTSIRVSSDQVHSFQSAFVQEKQLAMFDRPVLFKGKLSLVRPDRLRWEFTEPVASALIFNENSGLRCSEGVKPVKFSPSEDPVMKVVSEQLWLWLGGDYSSLEGRYRLEMVGEATLLVTPLDEADAAFLTSVLIDFDRTTLQPVQVEITEAGGDLTRLNFRDPIINTSFPPDIFESCDLNE
jgi:outer membrane lipoprotein-sorting protein